LIRRHRNAVDDAICSVLQPSSIRGLDTPWTHFLNLSHYPSFVILVDSIEYVALKPGHFLTLCMLTVSCAGSSRGIPGYNLTVETSADLILDGPQVSSVLSTV